MNTASLRHAFAARPSGATTLAACALFSAPCGAGRLAFKPDEFRAGLSWAVRGHRGSTNITLD